MAELQHLDGDREPHRDIRVAFGHVVAEAFNEQIAADQQEKRERQDRYTRMSFDETRQPLRRSSIFPPGLVL